MKILTGNGYVDGVALFFELTDEQLERVKNDKNYFFDKKFLNSCYEAKGDNVHVFFIHNAGDSKRIYKGYKKLLKQYKTVSFWNKDFSFKLLGR